MRTRFALAGFAALILASAAVPAQAQDNPFDGRWQGKMYTDAGGQCFPLRKLDLEIRNGKIIGKAGSGLFRITFHGSVGPDGRTSRTLAHSTQTLIRVLNGGFSGDEAFISWLGDSERQTRGGGDCSGVIRMKRVA